MSKSVSDIGIAGHPDGDGLRSVLVGALSSRCCVTGHGQITSVSGAGLVRLRGTPKTFDCKLSCHFPGIFSVGRYRSGPAQQAPLCVGSELCNFFIKNIQAFKIWQICFSISTEGKRIVIRADTLSCIYRKCQNALHIIITKAFFYFTDFANRREFQRLLMHGLFI